MSQRSLPGRRCGGSTLIEVLIAVLILSLGLLGTAALQARALRGGQGSIQRTQAIVLTNSLLDALRVDRTAAANGDYDTGNSPACNANTYTGTTLAQVQMRDWIAAVKRGVGRAGDSSTCVTVQCGNTPQCRVEIQWDDVRAQGQTGERLGVSTQL